MTRILSLIVGLFLSFNVLAETRLKPMVDGEYRVPVGDPALESSAVYPVRNMVWNLRGNELSLIYFLPVELTGRNDSEIALRGPNEIRNGEFRLRGDHGQADCEVLPTKPKEELVCRIDYKNLQFDAVAREAFLRQNYPSDFQKRITVARDFENDPIGVLRFRP